MSISDSVVTIQNGENFSLVVKVNKKQDIDPILLNLRVLSTMREWRFSSKGEIVYFATKVDCVFLMWVSCDSIFLQKSITPDIIVI